VLKKKIWANFQRILELFTKKFSKSSSKYGLGIRDPRSGIQGSKRHRIPDPDPQHWNKLHLLRPLLAIAPMFFAVAQGQKCSACSRMYVPESLWPAIKEGLIETRKSLKVPKTV
jgi:hypothetical protein